MATAPPAVHMPHAPSALPHLRFAPYFSPTLDTTSGSGFPWKNSMSPPSQPGDDGQTAGPSQSSSAASGKRPAHAGAMQVEFITVVDPIQFKDKKVMTRVRKKAMGHHLTTEGKGTKKPVTPGPRSRLPSEASVRSAPSVASSQEENVLPSTNTSTISRFVPSHPHSHATTSVISSVTSSHHGGHAPSEPSSLIAKMTNLLDVPSSVITPSRARLEDGSRLPYDVFPMPPLESLGRAFDPFNTMFQSGHPNVDVTELKYKCSIYFGTKALGRYWIPLALDHAHTFLGSLCLATTYDDVVRNVPTDSYSTIALRQEVIHLVGRNMTNPRHAVADHNLMAVINLIISEIICRDDAPLRYHEDGIEAMIRNRGGLEELGLEGRLASSISWISLASSILKEERPRRTYAAYCFVHSKREYPKQAKFPESPLHSPSSTNAFQALGVPAMCSEKTIQALNDITTMINLFLEKDAGHVQAISELYHKIVDTPYDFSTPEAGTGLTWQGAWRYKAIRLTAVILATAIFKEVPLSEALNDVQHNSATPFTSWSESAGSLFGAPRYSVASENLTSPTCPSYGTSPTAQWSTSYFAPTIHHPSTSSFSTHRSSNASSGTRASVSTSVTRPSIASSHYSSSEQLIPTQYPSQAPSHSSSDNSLLADLKIAVEHGGMLKCWDDMASVLFWIGLVVGAASKNCGDKSFQRFYSAITMRAGIMLCFEHPEAINATTYRMTELIEALSSHRSDPSLPTVAPKKQRRNNKG